MNACPCLVRRPWGLLDVSELFSEESRRGAGGGNWARCDYIRGMVKVCVFGVRTKYNISD